MPKTPALTNGDLPGVTIELNMLLKIIPTIRVIMKEDPNSQTFNNTLRTIEKFPVGPNKENVSTALERYQIVHLSCHGQSNATDPSQSRFLLHDWQTTPFAVSDLSSLNLQKAKFAFLAACRTADIQDIKLIDESIHLCSAVQLAGFPSVIGSLWEVVDKEAAQLAGDVYSCWKEEQRYRRILK